MCAIVGSLPGRPPGCVLCVRWPVSAVNRAFWRCDCSLFFSACTPTLSSQAFGREKRLATKTVYRRATACDANSFACCVYGIICVSEYMMADVDVQAHAMPL